MTDIQAGSPERFGYSWERFSELTPEQEKQFGIWTSPMAPDDWRDLRFLDAGCGAGRNSYWPMTYGAASGVAMDLDDRSLAAARANLDRFPKVEVIRGDIYQIPFEDDFDIAFSIGVVHHLDDPAAAIAQMTKAVKPGGTVLVWLYGHENLEFYVTVLAPLRRALFSRLPLPVVRWIAWVPTLLLWLLLRVGFRPIQYLKLLVTFPFRHLHHIVFDQMLPRTSRHYRRSEAEDLLKQAGLTDVACHWVNECSWTVIGTKPPR